MNIEDALNAHRLLHAIDARLAKYKRAEKVDTLLYKIQVGAGLLGSVLIGSYLYIRFIF